jgi:hypothetical protein
MLVDFDSYQLTLVVNKCATQLGSTYNVTEDYSAENRTYFKHFAVASAFFGFIDDFFVHFESSLHFVPPHFIVVA